MRFREDSYKEDDELIMAIKELNQRRQELKIMYNEFFLVWILGKMKKWKMESYEIQALRDVVKTGGEEVLEKLEKKFIYIRVKGKRKSPSSTMFTKTLEKLPVTHYTVKELEEVDTMYMGTSSEARKRFQGNSLNRGRGNSFSRG